MDDRNVERNLSLTWQASISKAVGQMTRVTAVIAGVIVALQLCFIYLASGPRLMHDEAEHLHVTYLLSMGERPYVDFIENHPMWFNLILLVINKSFDFQAVSDLYFAGKALTFVGFFGCILVAYLACADYGRNSRSGIGAVSLFLMILGFISFGSEGARQLWQLRPDWVCYSLSLASIFIHYRFHLEIFRGRKKPFWQLAVSATAGAAATAILAKSAFLFVPYGMLSCLIGLHIYKSQPRLIRTLLVSNGIFIGIGGALFALLVGTELSITGATLKDYINANFLINQVPHIVSGSREINPVSIMSGYLGVGLIPFAGSIMVVGALLLFTFRERNYFSFFFILYPVMVIGMNTILLAYSNGALWGQYFAPTLLAMLVLGYVVVDAILGKFLEFGSSANRESSGHEKSGKITIVGIILLALWFAYGYVRRADETAQSYENAVVQNELNNVMAQGLPERILRDRILPTDLTYLAFSPTDMPLRAKHWGIYFMLGPDKGFWSDYTALGLGPDPKTYWPKLFRESPPDVILLPRSGPSRDYWMQTLYASQGVDISWIFDKIASDYHCKAYAQIVVYARSRLDSRFSKSGWKSCDDRKD